MKIVHTYINNMYIDPNDPDKECFAHRWGLVSLAELGHDVTLICGGESRRRKEYIWNRIRVIELPTLFGFNTSSRILKHFVHEINNIKADVFHTHHYCSLIPELTVTVGKLRKIPTFVTFHNTFVEGNLFARSLGRIYLLGMQPFLVLFSKLFFISNYIKKRFSFSFIPAKKKRTTYNQIRPPPRQQVTKTDHSIIFVGRLTHQKGVDILLQAMAIVKQKIPDVTLSIIGGGKKKYVAKLNAMVKELGLSENVHFLGKKYGEEKWNYFYKSHVMVIPSRDEGFGNVVIEGMLCGLPVIISNKGALSEAAGGHGIVFEISKKKDLARKIIKLLTDANLREEKARLSQQYALNFTERSLGKQLVEEYQRMITKSI